MRVLCELSGGADSALAAIYAQRKYPEADRSYLFVDYGQPYARQEEAASRYLRAKLEDGAANDRFGIARWRVVSIAALFGSAFRGEDRVEEYFPLRNLVIGAVACSVAEQIGAEVIVTGSKGQVPLEDDPFAFRDSVAPFYALLEATANYALAPKRVRIEPLLALNRKEKMSKEQVYRELWENGISPAETWSCYHPTGDGKECKVCRNCKEKTKSLGVMMR